MENYEINEETLAIIPSKNKSIVYEKYDKFVVNKPVNKIMEESCEYFGSSLSGRQKGTTKLIGVSHKAPIIVEETKEIIFFPTTSPRLTNCSWISLNNYKNHYRKKGKTVIEFGNKEKIEFKISLGIISNQHARSTKLSYALNQRKRQKS